MKTRICLALVLILAACASYERPYVDYEKPDYVTVLGDLPRLPGVHTFINEVPVDFEEIDGMKLLPDSNSSRTPLRRIDVAPGTHRMRVRVAFPPAQFPGDIDLNVAANHVFRLTGIVKTYGYWLEVWDESGGFAKRTLIREIELESTAPDLPRFIQINPQRATR